MDYTVDRILHRGCKDLAVRNIQLAATWNRRNILDLQRRYGEDVPAQHHQVGQLPWLDRAL